MKFGKDLLEILFFCLCLFFYPSDLALDPNGAWLRRGGGEGVGP